MSAKERIYLFDTTLSSPSARTSQAREDGQTGKPVARKWSRHVL